MTTARHVAVDQNNTHNLKRFLKIMIDVVSAQCFFMQRLASIEREIMPIYYFDTAAANLCVRDDDGVECTSLSEDKRLATRVLSEMAMHQSTDIQHQAFTVRVRDLTGALAYMSTLRLDGR